jgi:hypothetical protein
MYGRARLSSDVSEKGRVSDSSEAANAQYRAELESGVDRPAAGRPLRCEGTPAQSRCDALGPGAVLGQGHQGRFRQHQREAFRQRRRLVPVDNFYEWKKVDGGKQRYAIALKSRRLMALAGVWENWRSPVGERIRSFAIVTTAPNELCAELHNMPAIIAPEAWPAWLGETRPTRRN